MVASGDGKIRLRCPGCGKRVKFPEGQPGQAYRCPICHTTIVAPLDGDDIHLPSHKELTSVAGKFASADDAQRIKKSIVSHRPKGTRARRHPVERLGSFMSQENQRTTQLSCAILFDDTTSDKEKTDKLQALRQSKGVRLKQYVLALHKDLDKQIMSLRNSAAADTPSNMQNIAELEERREQLRLYVKVMFQLQAPA